MLRRTLLIVLLAAAFFYGIAHLFLMRFRTGDVYPPYSTLRTDPLGAKAFYDSLDELPQLDVRRNLRPIWKLKPQAPATILYLGTPYLASWGDDELHEVESLLMAGSRVVITFLPISRGLSREEITKNEKEEREAREKAIKAREKKRGTKKKNEPEKKNAKDDDAQKLEEEKPIAFAEVAKRWGFEFAFLEGDVPADRKAAPPGDFKAPIEPKISWHTALVLKPTKPEWHTVLSAQKQPVMIERSFGKGSIVLATDSYFLSNEALRNERCPKLLTWLVGHSPLIVFDEESHGVREDPGIAALARKYQLHGAIVALVLLAVLFVWKNAIAFVPPLEDAEKADVVIGEESRHGFVNLLRRSIPPGEVLDVCAREWKRSFDHTGRNLKSAHLDRVLVSEAAKTPRNRNAVAAYRTISEMLSKK